eukprot:gene34475-42516_t
MSEPPEHDLITRSPRQFRDPHLLTFSVILYSYMFYGNMAAIGAFFNYFAYMASRGDTEALHGNTIPRRVDPSIEVPIGYRANQLVFAWNFGYDNQSAFGRDQLAAWHMASSIVYLTVTIAQLGQLLSIRCKRPYFYDWIVLHQPFTFTVQWPVVWAWAASIVTLLLTLYIPEVNIYCATAPVPLCWWGLAIGWSALWFVLAEARKWVIALYPESWVARWDW